MPTSAPADAITFKVLVVGAFGIGKTTLIQQVSDVPVVGTEVRTWGDEAAVKPTTTVGVEYGLYSVADDDAVITLLLFGTPGQDRFALVRDVAAQGMDGLIVIIDAEDHTTWSVGRSLHEIYNPEGGVPTLLVINRAPGGSDIPPGAAAAVGLSPQRSAVSCGDVVDSGDARRFLVDLLMLILHDLEDEEDGG
ncbi:MAG: hypothetical protein R2761_30120 [Acidimicrobiales bacterium]